MSDWEQILNFDIPSDSLLNHLLFCCIEPSDYLDTFYNLQLLLSEKEYLSKHPGEANEEAQYIDDDISIFNDRLYNMRLGWQMSSDSTIEKEIELIEKFIERN